MPDEIPRVYMDMVNSVYSTNTGGMCAWGDLITGSILVPGTGMVWESGPPSSTDGGATTALFNGAANSISGAYIGVAKFTDTADTGGGGNMNIWYDGDLSSLSDAWELSPPSAVWAGKISEHPTNPNVENTVVFSSDGTDTWMSLNGAATVMGGSGAAVFHAETSSPPFPWNFGSSSNPVNGTMTLSFFALYAFTATDPPNYPAFGANPPGPSPPPSPPPPTMFNVPIPTPLPCIPCCGTAAPICECGPGH